MSEAAGTIQTAETEEEQGGTRNPFASADYRKWWAASVLVGLGLGIQLVSVPLFVRDRVDPDYRALAFMGALLAETVPASALVLIGGVVADRVERRAILVRAFIAAALVSSIYLALSGYGFAAVWPAFGLAAVVGALGAFTAPARQAMIPTLLTRQQLQNGVILGTVAFVTALNFGGPVIGGLLADGPGLPAAFGAEVALLAAGALMFLRLSRNVPEPKEATVRSDLVEGLRYVASRKVLLGLLFISLLPGIFFVGPIGVTLVLFVEDVFETSDKFVGILAACFGGGLLVGSLLLTTLTLTRRGYLLCCSIVAAGLTFWAFGVSDSLPLSMAILVFWGCCAAVFINLAVALLQELAEAEMMGRVMGMYALAAAAAAPVGYLQAGLVADRWGPEAAVVSSAVIVTAIGVGCLLFLSPVRNLR